MVAALTPGWPRSPVIGIVMASNGWTLAVMRATARRYEWCVEERTTDRDRWQVMRSHLRRYLSAAASAGATRERGIIRLIDHDGCRAAVMMRLTRPDVLVAFPDVTAATARIVAHVASLTDQDAIWWQGDTFDAHPCHATYRIVHAASCLSLPPPV